MGNFSHNPSQTGNTERNSTSEIFAICQTWLNVRHHRWQKHCKLWNMRKPLRSQTLLYNIRITQERSPVSKMNVRKFSVRAAITRHPKAHMRDSCQIPDHSEVFLPQLDSEHRGWLQRWEQIQKLISEVMFQQMSDYWYWDRSFKYMKALQENSKRNYMEGNSGSKSHVTEIWL